MTTQDKINAQIKYCHDNQLPLFAPENEKCPFCNKNVYTKITVEEASKHLMTSCWFCKRSWTE